MEMPFLGLFQPMGSHFIALYRKCFPQHQRKNKQQRQQCLGMHRKGRQGHQQFSPE